MSSKVKKGTPWYCCDKCQVLLTQKEMTIHEINCPPSTEKWNHSYIQNNILYSNLEVYKSQERPKNVSEQELNDIVFMAQSAMQLCKISIGDPVILNTKDNVIVKTAWPTNDKTLTSVLLTKTALELNKLEGLVKVQRLESNVYLAREFIIEHVGKQQLPKVTGELDIVLKNYNERRIFCIGNRLSIPYYGKRLIYKIVEAKAEKIIDKCFEDEQDLTKDLDKLSISKNDLRNMQFYKAQYSTKWTVLSDNRELDGVENKTRNKVEDIGGYDNLIADIRDVIDIALGKYRTIKGFNISKGILLHGAAGVGKSMIASALMSEYDAEIFAITGPEIYSKYIGETETKLKDLFNDAKLRTPSIIFIEDIDNLCPRKSSSSTEYEKRVLTTLVMLIDNLQNCNVNILVLATTSRLDLVDSSLRRPGRIDKEFEVCVPTPEMRKEIFLKFLLKVPNLLTEEDVRNISFVTHGFVGADLYALCSRAAMHAIKLQQKVNDSSDANESNVKVTMEDFNYALSIVKPSAMKEVLVEVPNVMWSDIGGQKDLKLKLKQAVEWPLKHPEAFTRLGITPPRGVLMFGPPGCSKTMIAKALATESKLNFLNIKGPELFSKWVGESERAVREVFRKARQVAPSIIFIDEIDALCGERASTSSSGGNNVQERVLAQLLTELDGVTALGNITLVAATNRPDRIDKALLRPGRLDRIVYVPLPDSETRREIFNIKLRKMPVSKDVDITDLVDLSEGYSGAEVQAICHEAAMKALEEDLNACTITKEHFKAALAIVTPRTPASLIKLYDDYMNRI